MADTVAAQWTPERGWHNVTEAERLVHQAATVRRLTTPRWVQRAQSGALAVKDMTGGAA